MILDGGPCSVGVESTIIDITGKHVVLLRAGGLSLEELEGFLNEKVLISRGNPDLPSSPGQMLKHYAPTHPMRINAETPLPGEFFIGFGKVAGANLNLSPSGDTKEAAANLFPICVMPILNPAIPALPCLQSPKPALDLQLTTVSVAPLTKNKPRISGAANRHFF